MTPRLSRLRLGRLAAVLFAVAAVRGTAQAQEPLAESQQRDDGIWSDVFVGSEQESYLRLSQLSGDVAAYPWSIRGFGIREVERIGRADGPWSERYPLWSQSLVFSPAQVTGAVTFNSGFPQGGSDGPIWAGRGITTSAEARLSFRYRQLSGTLAPIVFWSQNASFDLMPTDSEDPFRDGRFPELVDLPQRFGDGGFARVDPGQSTVRIDYGGLAAGVSTANQSWGPARTYPILLGANGPGFAHLFLGTSTPANVWIGRLHGRVVWGDLRQSAHSPAASDEGRRFMAGMVAVFTPRFLPELELGGARFFHLPWPEEGLGSREFFRPFEGIFKRSVDGPGYGTENQLASLFGRWVFPESGVEVYGEFAREDHSFDFRDFVLEPDHTSAFVLGFQRLWDGDARWVVLRGEYANADVTHLEQVRSQTYFYVHTMTRQGHTHRGQLLGSPAVYGGGGGMMALDVYNQGGRLTTYLERERRGEGRNPADPTAGWSHDVIYSAGVEVLRFGSSIEWATGLAGSWNMNRHFGDDRFNLNAKFLLRARL